MERTIPLSTKVGEVMAPQTLVAALIVGPDGTVTLDPGVLHGRSEVERGIEFVKQRDQVAGGQPFAVVWVAIELDSSNQPVRYKGTAVSELTINPTARRGYKSVAEATNRIGEAVQGKVNVAKLKPEFRASVKQRLIALGQELWDRAPDSLKQGLSA